MRFLPSCLAASLDRTDRWASCSGERGRRISVDSARLHLQRRPLPGRLLCPIAANSFGTLLRHPQPVDLYRRTSRPVRRILRDTEPRPRRDIASNWAERRGLRRPERRERHAFTRTMGAKVRLPSRHAAVLLGRELWPQGEPNTTARHLLRALTRRHTNRSSRPGSPSTS